VTTLLVDVGQLADMHIVYRLFDAAGRLVYVGMTSDFGRRLNDHAGKAWFLAVTAITVERFPGYADAVLAEDQAINTENPIRNKVGISREEATRRKQVQKLRFSEDKLRAAQDRQRLAAERKQQVADEKQRAAEDRERLMREQPPRDLLADLDQILDGERVRLSALPHLLRKLAPTHAAYQTLNGMKIWDELKRQGVRVTKTGNIPRLDPADLHRRSRTTELQVQLWPDPGTSCP